MKEDFDVLPLWYLIIAVALSLVSVTGNGIVIFLIATRRRLHNPTNWIILSLAVADFLVGTGYVPTQYLLVVLSFEYDLYYSIVSFLFAASCINLCLLTFDRYIFITKPLRYVTLVTKRRAVIVICLVWIASFLPHLLFYAICDVWSLGDLPQCRLNFNILDFIAFETLPTVISFALTVRIFYIARRRLLQTEIQMAQLRFNERIKEEGSQAATRRETNSTTKIIGIAVGAFTIASLVQLIYTSCYQLTGKEPNWDFLNASGLFYLLSSAINPVAYALFKGDIKESLGSALTCTS